MMIHNGGRAVQVSYGRNLSRNEEREAVGKLADAYRQRNTNYRQTGAYSGLMKANERTGLLDNLRKGELRPSEAPSFTVELSPEAQQIMKRNVSVDVPSKEAAECLPVTEIRSDHFRWTEADGIEETITEAEELAARKESFRQLVTETISQSIGEILKPRTTYEEAIDALYKREDVAWKARFDDSNYGFTQVLTPVNGAFGKLAVHLNDYLDQFGTEDGYFDTLISALDELDEGNDNALIGQMCKMVQTVRDGNAIDTQSDDFKNEVQDAVDKTYGVAKKKVRRQKGKKNGKQEGTEQAGLSYLDMERHKAKEEKQLLEKFTGEEKSEKPASAGEVRAQHQRKEKDTDFRDKMRKVDEYDLSGQENPVAPAKAKQKGTPIEKEEAERLTANYNAWNKISERYGWGTMPEV